MLIFRHFRPLLLAAVLLAAPLLAAPLIAVTAAAAAPGARASGVALQYRALLAGMQVGTVSARLSDHGADYRLDGKIETQGALTLFLPWTYRAVSQGRIAGEHLDPVNFWGAGEYKGKPRHIQVTFNDSGATIDSARPDPADKPKQVVPPELRRGTLDPLSALFALGRNIGRNGDCDQRVAVFDGRYRFDLHVMDDATAEGHGKIRCRFFYEPIAGFKDDGSDYAATRDKPGRVWFQRLQPSGPAVPVRVEADTGYGRFLLELVNVTAGERTALR